MQIEAEEKIFKAFWLLMRMSKQVVPHDGWKFLQGECWIFGHSFDNLVSIVKTHRISNGIVIGEVEKDVMQQIMELNPSFRIKN